MTHKGIIVDKRFPYYGTKTPIENSISEIKKMLMKKGRGVRKVGDLSDHLNTDTPAYTLMVEMENGYQILIEFPLTFRKPGAGKEPVLDMRISGRLMFFHVKDLIAMAEVGFLSMTQAFSPWLALPDADGTLHPFHEFVPDREGKVAASRPIVAYLQYEMKQLEAKAGGVR